MASIRFTSKTTNWVRHPILRCQTPCANLQVDFRECLKRHTKGYFPSPYWYCLHTPLTPHHPTPPNKLFPRLTKPSPPKLPHPTLDWIINAKTSGTASYKIIIGLQHQPIRVPIFVQLGLGKSLTLKSLSTTTHHHLPPTTTHHPPQTFWRVLGFIGG